MEMLLGAIGIASSVAGTIQGFKGASDLNKATNEEIEQQKKQIALQQQMMQLEFNRQQRSTIRQSIIARSQARATATAQGAAQPGSSALGGAYAGIAGSTNNKLGALSQNLLAGNTQISNEYGMLSAERDVAGAQSELQMAQGLQNLGSGISGQLNNLTKLGNTGVNFFKGLLPA